MENETDVTIKLSKPIKSFGKELNEITLREPTGKDYREIGCCVIFKADGDSVTFDPVKNAQMIERCAGLAVGTLDQLSYKEVNHIALKMLPFFV